MGNGRRVPPQLYLKLVVKQAALQEGARAVVKPVTHKITVKAK
jgi:hypothetical protein